MRRKNSRRIQRGIYKAIATGDIVALSRKIVHASETLQGTSKMSKRESVLAAARVVLGHVIAHHKMVLLRQKTNGKKQT